MRVKVEVRARMKDLMQFLVLHSDSESVCYIRLRDFLTTLTSSTTTSSQRVFDR